MTAKQWTGAVRIGAVAAALAAFAIPAGQLLAQQPAPTAATPATSDKVDEARVQKGREIFAGWSCTSCHALVDADSHGDVGPHLDGAGLTETFIVQRVTNGQGAMPAFGGQLTPQEIADVAYYITKVAKKG